MKEILIEKEEANNNKTLELGKIAQVVKYMPSM